MFLCLTTPGCVFFHYAMTVRALSRNCLSRWLRTTLACSGMWPSFVQKWVLGYSGVFGTVGGSHWCCSSNLEIKPQDANSNLDLGLRVASSIHLEPTNEVLIWSDGGFKCCWREGFLAEWPLEEACSDETYRGRKVEEPLFLRSLSRGFLLLAFYFGPLAQALSDIQARNCYQPSAGFCVPLTLDVYSHYIPPPTRCIRSHISNRVPVSRNSPELDSHPVVLVCPDFTQQRLPEVSVLDCDSIALLPAIPDPSPSPVGGAFNGVLGIGGDHQCIESLAAPVSETQRGDDSAELRSVAGLKSVVTEGPLFL